jgi:hypothetical protein
MKHTITWNLTLEPGDPGDQSLGRLLYFQSFMNRASPGAELGAP